jgi:DNA-binding response OmpR family regulator
MNTSEQWSAPSSRGIRSSVGAWNEERPVRVLVLASKPVVVEPARVALNDSRILLREARSQPDSMALLDSWRPDLAIVDFDMNAAKFVERLTGRLAVIAVTRRGDLQTKLSAFDRGADDVLVVPFASEELLARVLAMWRRAYQATPFARLVRSGELEIDMLRDRMRVGDAEVRLTPTERGLLYLLVANAGRVLTRDEILDALWGAEHTAESNVVDQHVRNLRAKLQDISRQRPLIATVPGEGYRFLFDDSVESSPSSTFEGPRLQHCRDIDGLQESDFDRIQGVDDRRAVPNLAAIAA